jgi:FdrA protein
MLYSAIKKNSYQDSVSLMLISSAVAGLPGVAQFTAMMGSDPNKDIMRNAGLYAPELDAATANDICMVVEAANEAARDAAWAGVEERLALKAGAASSSGLAEARSWEGALKARPDANLALISIPGSYAAAEARKALDKGLNVLLFSDNVSQDDERSLKLAAREKGLLVMGPDCGTAIIGGIPLAFANKVARGAIGLVAASGTGLQEITSLIDKQGEGISAAVGTGGRDLSEGIGGLTTLSALEYLAGDPDTEIIVAASKPPAKSVRDAVIGKLRAIPKPVVAVFLGEVPEIREDGNIRYAHTLEEAASLAVKQSRASEASGGASLDAAPSGTLKGLYSGGTLASEAAMLLSEAFGRKGEKSEEILWKLDKNEIVDLGEDCYTRGRPHPMIDPTLRLAMLRERALLPETAVILFDVVLGCGAHADMGSVMAEAVEKLRGELAPGRAVRFVAALCGTRKDPQGYEKQMAALARAGVTVRESNASAVRAAIKLLASLKAGNSAKAANPLFARGPAVVNVGLRGFAEDLAGNNCPVVHYEWRPVAGGDERLAKLLAALE